MPEENIGPDIEAICHALTLEVAARIESPLTGKDKLAISVAIVKAATRGVAVMSTIVGAQLTVEKTLDPWERRYGQLTTEE